MKLAALPLSSCLSALLLLLSGSVLLPALATTWTPGALDVKGWAADTRGGAGGTIVRVTNLNASGQGSFAQAVSGEGARIVVFEVGGVIDLQGATLRITEPFITIAGQTAPHPGITFVRGGLAVATHDVIIQHIAVRPGENGRAKKSGWDVDGLSASGAYNLIVDHCSFSRTLYG